MPDLSDRAIAHSLVESPLVEHVPRAGSRLAGGRLDEVELRPRDIAFEELLAALVEDAGVATVDLGERDELGLAEVDIGHVAAVELVQAVRERRAALEREPEPIAGAPGIGAQPQGRGRPDVPLDERSVALEAAGRKHQCPFRP